MIPTIRHRQAIGFPHAEPAADALPLSTRETACRCGQPIVLNAHGDWSHPRAGSLHVECLSSHR
jgi:hypothetical protein